MRQRSVHRAGRPTGRDRNVPWGIPQRCSGAARGRDDPGWGLPRRGRPHADPAAPPARTCARAHVRGCARGSTVCGVPAGTPRRTRRHTTRDRSPALRPPTQRSPPFPRVSPTACTGTATPAAPTFVASVRVTGFAAPDPCPRPPMSAWRDTVNRRAGRVRICPGGRMCHTSRGCRPPRGHPSWWITTILGLSRVDSDEEQIVG